MNDLAPPAEAPPAPPAPEDDYKHAPLRCIRDEVRLATEELDRLGVEKYEGGDGDEWSIVKRIRLLAARPDPMPPERRAAYRQRIEDAGRTQAEGARRAGGLHVGLAGPVNDAEAAAINAAYDVMLDDGDLPDDFEAAKRMALAALAAPVLDRGEPTDEHEAFSTATSEAAEKFDERDEEMSWVWLCAKLFFGPRR